MADPDEEQSSNLDTESLSKQIAKGGGIGFSGQILGKGLRFVLQIVLTRVLGPGAYGLYSLGYTVVGITRRASMLGLQNGVVRFGSRYRGEDDKERLKGTLLAAITLSFIAGTVSGILLFFFAPPLARIVFNKPEIIPVLKGFSFSLPFYTLLVVVAKSARAFRRIEYDVGPRMILHPILDLALAGGAFLVGYRLLGAVYAFAFSAFLSVVASIVLLWQIFPPLISSLSAKVELKKLLSYSVTVLLAGFAGLLVTKTDRVMLGALVSSSDVGIYNAANVLSAQASLFLIGVSSIFAPIISDLFNRDMKAKLARLFKLTTKWVFSLTLPVYLVFVFFSEDLMGLFGSEFVVGWPVLLILGGAQLINASVGSVGYMLTMSGKEKVELANNVTLGVLNIGLNLVLIRIYGLYGAALATGISIGLINLVKLTEVFYFYGFHPYMLSFWKTSVAGLVTAGSGAIIRFYLPLPGWSWIGGAALMGLIYFILIVLLGLEKEEKAVLEGLKTKFVG